MFFTAYFFYNSSKHPTFSDGQSRACLNEPAVSTYKWFARISSSMSSQGKTRQTKNLNDRSFTNELGAGAEFAAPVGEASDPLGTKWQWYWVWDNRHWQREPWGMMGNVTAAHRRESPTTAVNFLVFWSFLHHDWFIINPSWPAQCVLWYLLLVYLMHFESWLSLLVTHVNQ